MARDDTAPLTVKWDQEPAEHDYPAAANYLSLIADTSLVDHLIKRLKKAPLITYKAKDLIRSSGLPLLPLDDDRVRADLIKVVRGQALSPVLLIRGDLRRGVPMQIADGYHRVCASYHLADNTDIPARIINCPPDNDV